MSLRAFVVQLICSIPIGWAVIRLLRGNVSIPRYTAAVIFCFFLATLWLVDLESASRVVIGSVEIDRRVKLAEDAINRLQKLEQSASETAKNLNEMLAKAQAAERRFAEFEERESLRPWAMVLPSGDVALDGMGIQKRSTGEEAKLHQKVFITEGSKMGFAGPRCADETYRNDIKALIERFPKVPYGRVALVFCLKWRGDPSWREEAERAKEHLEKMIAIRPHVLAIDGFYGQIVMELGLDLTKTLEGTGYMKMGKDGVYLIDAP